MRAAKQHRRPPPLPAGRSHLPVSGEARVKISPALLRSPSSPSDQLTQFAPPGACASTEPAKPEPAKPEPAKPYEDLGAVKLSKFHAALLERLQARAKGLSHDWGISATFIDVEMVPPKAHAQLVAGKLDDWKRNGNARPSDDEHSEQRFERADWFEHGSWVRDVVRDIDVNGRIGRIWQTGRNTEERGWKRWIDQWWVVEIGGRINPPTAVGLAEREVVSNVDLEAAASAAFAARAKQIASELEAKGSASRGSIRPDQHFESQQRIQAREAAKAAEEAAARKAAKEAAEAARVPVVAYRIHELNFDKG